MTPGFAVVRLPARAVSNTLIIETRAVPVLADHPGGIVAARQHARRLAGDWAQGVAVARPEDDVFVVETGATFDPDADTVPTMPTDRDRPASTCRHPMAPGFYVVRQAVPGAGTRMIVESVPFAIRPDIDGDDARLRARMSAENWRDYIQGQHPRDLVFVIERESAPEEKA